MSNIKVEQSIETTPLNPAPTDPPPSYGSLTLVGNTVGTRFFLVSTLIAAIIPAIQLGVGISYNGQCPIDQRISTYMSVAGGCGLALVVLAILLAATFKWLLKDPKKISGIATCGIGFNVLVSTIISIFLFIWFIFGCVWVFSVASRVQFKEPFGREYCQPVLYQWAFALLIITFLWVLIQCCVACFRGFRVAQTLQ